jgi:RimJ/RimL family protein N-acetyltransferase
MRPPTLTDGEDPDRITLRPHRPADAEAVLEACSDAETQRWTSVPSPYTRADAEAFVSGAAPNLAEGTLALAIEAVDDATGAPRYAGSLTLRRSGGAGGLGFSLAPWARGRGVMSRAVRLLLQWAFDEPDTADEARGGAGLDVVHWEAFVGNWASRRVAWACGFRVEGTVRGFCLQRGERHDAWVGSIVRGDPMAPSTPWLEAATVVGERVVLRPWREQDVPRVAEACSDPQTQHWLANLPSPYTVADAQWYIRSREEEHASGRGVYWCVADPGDDRCLAAISLMRLDAPLAEAEIGYWAHPEARGRGVMTEATALVARHALMAVEDGGLGQFRVCLRAAAGNVASNRVAERAGLRRVGLARGSDVLRDGSRDDHVLYDLVLTDELGPPA